MADLPSVTTSEGVGEIDRGTVPPQMGGCWFCYTNDPKPTMFSIELDTYYHESCARVLGVWSENDDPVLAWERKDE